MSKKSKKTTPPKSKLLFDLPSQKDYLDTFAAYLMKKNPEYYWDNRNEVFRCYIGQEDTCCGFQTVGDFSSFDTKLFETYKDVIAEKFAEAIKKYGRPYFSAYVPDTKEYENVRTLLEKAGFTKAISVPSLHSGGRYTNTRWEWIKPRSKVKVHAKAIHTIPV